MEIGYFSMPSHPPECGLKEGHDWDLQTLRWLDELGYQEAWIGEHHTAPWEPHPSPDLLLAQAFLQTKNIRLGPGGFLLPYHHPAELANRVAMLDHLSGGRLNFGVAASGLPSDWAMFNVDGMSGQNRDMTREALEIILRLWTEDAPFTHKGEFFLPLLGHFGFKDYLKHAPDVPDSDVTVDYCARHNWVVGSPSTVAEKIETIYREVGGFGTLLVFGFDYKHKPEAWHHSLTLLQQEVMPRLKHLNADLERAA